MIICAPDMTTGVASRFGVEPCVLVTLGMRLRRQLMMKTLADTGLAGARRGVDAAMYITYIRNIKPTWAVAPDRFADFRATLALWFRYSHVISKYTIPILVAQEFYRAHVFDAIMELLHMGVERVALPLRMHPDAICALRPRLCAERAERALRALCGVAQHIHLLGPALRVLRKLRGVLKNCEKEGSLVSLDTAAYRRASNSELKRLLGGRWMPRDSREAELMLEAWLRQALL